MANNNQHSSNNNSNYYFNYVLCFCSIAQQAGQKELQLVSKAKGVVLGQLPQLGINDAALNQVEGDSKADSCSQTGVALKFINEKTNFGMGTKTLSIHLQAC